MEKVDIPLESDPLLGQEEQLDQVNAAPMSGLNKKRPKCITPRCPSKGRCKCPGFDGPDRDYTENLGENNICGYFKTTEEVWKPSP